MLLHDTGLSSQITFLTNASPCLAVFTPINLHYFQDLEHRMFSFTCGPSQLFVSFDCNPLYCHAFLPD